ncbi:hypothetical protein BUALT_Bualt12G0079800 [Buddleja alternifolia]|uniref:F-box domain-containing protein n=1 Tax=Buddleja alternifolia TaxID=168488 RepID=A0AAV6X067_9LAMI|nr:hypothetical protein BUALT_Bualt12G0079800 [Buddleja alternifolia]
MISSSDSTTSYEEESLPRDVILEILSRLPPENLLNFRSVCRSWLSIIRDAKFIAKSNLRNENTNGRIIIITEEYPNPYRGLKLRILSDTNPAIIQDNTKLVSAHNKSMIGYYRVMSTCNGLFCYAGVQDDYGIQLCNPCGRWATSIRQIRFTNYLNKELYYGVGYDPLTNDYKVIKLMPPANWTSPPTEAAIYSVKAKIWKRLNDRLPSETPSGRSIFLHGNIHWLAKTVSPPFKIEFIMLFDVCDEVFGEIELPEIDERNKYTSISVVKGLLCLLVTEICADNRICHVWMMKEYGVVESWTKQCTVALRKDITTCIEVTPGGKIMCSIESNAEGNGKMLYVERTPSKLVLYDPETDQYRNAGETLPFRPAFSLEASLELVDGSGAI